MSEFEQQTKKINPKNPKTLAVIGLGLLLIIGIIVYAFSPRAKDIDSSKPGTSQSSSEAREAQVTITPEGFLPATLIVNKNTTVVFTNNDDKPRQLQANPHPTGDSLPNFKSEVLGNNQTYSYTFKQSGIFRFHDHLDPTINGSIEVK